MRCGRERSGIISVILLQVFVKSMSRGVYNHRQTKTPLYTQESNFKRGQAMRGKKHTKEWKEKMKGCIPWNKGKEVLAIKGDKNPNWKGGVSLFHQQIRQGIKFKIWREAIFKKDDYICWICGQRGGKLHPHHIFSFSKYPELRFNIQNGITLCEFCHRNYTNFRL